MVFRVKLFLCFRPFSLILSLYVIVWRRDARLDYRVKVENVKRYLPLLTICRLQCKTLANGNPTPTSLRAHLKERLGTFSFCRAALHLAAAIARIKPHPHYTRIKASGHLVFFPGPISSVRTSGNLSFTAPSGQTFDCC